jgi:hypothetical protein
LFSFYVLFLIYLEDRQHEEEYVDYAAVMDQLETRISVRYGNSIMEEGVEYGGKKLAYFILNSILSFKYLGGYNEQLRIIDFPVYVSGSDDNTNLTPLVPNT